MYKYQLVKLIVFIVLLVSPIILILLPVDFFDYGESICPSKRFLDIECLGCGMTRAVTHLINLDFKGAWAFNKLSFIVVPLGAYLWGKTTYNVYKDLDLKK